jgi:flagellar biosynthesis/type III secretory pathway chaperone
MIGELNEIMVNEINVLSDLLAVLEEQHSAYVKKDLFALEGVVKKIQNANVAVAKFEVQRRKLVGNKGMKTLIKELSNAQLEENFSKMSNILIKLQSQKETNEFLIKQGLSFTNRMLNIFRPNKVAKTYNNYGKMRL